MGQHAILSASASKRWMNCTPSALLEKQFADEESIYAAEGTAAHALAEHKLKRFLKKRSKRPVSDYDCDEMEECTDDYVSFAMEQIEKAKQSCSDPVVMIEQRLDFSRWVPEGFGTGDLVIVADDTLYIVDLKYGKQHGYWSEAGKGCGSSDGNCPEWKNRNTSGDKWRILWCASWRECSRNTGYYSGAFIPYKYQSNKMAFQ